MRKIEIKRCKKLQYVSGEGEQIQAHLFYFIKAVEI